MNRKFVALGVAAAVVIIVILVAVVISDRSNTPTVLTTKNAKAVTLDNTATVTFPCDAQANSLSSGSSTSPRVYDADCAAYTNGSNQGFIYSAALEQFSPASSEQKATLNYCTAHTSYPGLKAGSKIYIIQPHEQTADGKKFSVCDSSDDTRDNTFEATARAAAGSSVLVLQVDAPEPPAANTIQTAMRTFVGTVQFDK